MSRAVAQEEARTEKVRASLASQGLDVAEVLQSNEQVSVEYNFDFEDGEIILRRTVWNTAYRRTDRHVVFDAIIGRFDRTQFAKLIADGVMTLSC